MKLGIQTSLTLFFLMIMILSLPVFLLFTLQITTRMLDQQVRYQLESEAAESAEIINLVFKPVESVLRRLSENYSLQEYLRAQDLLQNEELPAERRSALLDSAELSRRAAEDEFRRLLQLSPEYGRVVFMDQSGTILIEVSRDETPLQDPVDWLFEQTIRKERGEAVVEDRVMESEVLRYAMPVIRDENVGVEDQALQPALALLGTPFREQEGILILDFRFEALREKLQNLRVIGTAGGAFFLIDAQDHLLVTRERYRPLLERFLAARTIQERGGKYSWRGEDYLITLWPYPQRRWQVGIVAPQSEFTLYLEQASRTLIILSILLFSITLVVALVFIRRIAEPLRNFVQVASQIALGNFAVRVSPRGGGREIADLAGAFNEMAGRLETYLEDVRKKEQMEQELKIAHHIQAGLLPKKLPEVEGIRFDARAIPAREVGGDYYDFIANGEGSLGLIIGDVTGRGVPAALLMTMIRSILRSEVRDGAPDEVFRNINNLIHEDVKESRHSVAMFYGVLDPAEKTFRFANAGLVFPLWYRRRQNLWQYLELSGIPLGIRRDVVYRTEEIHLEAGDRLVFYTDGVVESLDRSSEVFGFKRLEEILHESRDLSPAETIEHVLAQLRSYVGQDAPEDDVTLAVLDICMPESEDRN